MRFVTISDTHRKHRRIQDLPPGDVIIHAGDITSRGTEQETNDFLEWFSGLDYTHKIFIAGNHDFLLEETAPEDLDKLIPANVTYLNDSATEINGVKIWGSPVTPWYHDWAFNRHRGAAIARHWQKIPGDTDIIVAHGPVHGILDYTSSGIYAGCEELRKRVEEVRPAYFISGHIHEQYGWEQQGETIFINASVLNELYAVKNRPIVFDFSPKQVSLPRMA